MVSAAADRLADDGIAVEAAQPDLSMADRAFDVPRGLGYALNYGADLERIRELIKPENVWNIEYGLKLTTAEILDSMAAQGEIFNHAAGFMQDYDLLICPASIHLPYPVEERYPGFSAGVPYSEYYRWLRLVYAITATTLPVITLPCGPSESGLPVGVQVIGKPHGETDLFAHAAHLEQLFNFTPLNLGQSKI